MMIPIKTKWSPRNMSYFFVDKNIILSTNDIIRRGFDIFHEKATAKASTTKKWE